MDNLNPNPTPNLTLLCFCITWQRSSQEKEGKHDSSNNSQNSLQSCKPRGQQCEQPAASGSWSPCYGPRTRCRMASTRRKGGTCNSMHSGNVRAAQKHVRNAGQRRRRVSSRLTNGAIVERQGFQCANPAGQRDDRTSVKWTANPSGTATAD